MINHLNKIDNLLINICSGEDHTAGDGHAGKEAQDGGCQARPADGGDEGGAEEEEGPRWQFRRGGGRQQQDLQMSLGENL